jgi:adenylosuccinate lyase
VKQTEFRGGAPGGPPLATNHDVKAVEYFLKHKFTQISQEAGLGELLRVKEFIHFGLTSQDVNNTCYPLMIQRFFKNVYLPKLAQIITTLDTFARHWGEIPLLARTHGQPASPTRMGKEIMVFVARLKSQVELLDQVPHCAKFGGATGNMNAHKVAYPDRDWPAFANALIEGMGLQRYQCTTQIEHYDNMAALFDGCRRVDTILIDLCRDVWTYISQGLFKQKTKAGEIGSSAMPHKVNPIDFENAEGNFGVASALFEFFSGKLPISRLQRDLTDSTVTRNIGVPFGHCIVAFDSLLKGLNKLKIDERAIAADLNSHWEVTAEAIQTVLRREQVDGAYELLKEETRGEVVTEQTVAGFVDKLEKHPTIKLGAGVIAELRAITPSSYTGFFDAGETLEAWSARKLSKTNQGNVAASIAKQREALVDAFNY